MWRNIAIVVVLAGCIEPGLNVVEEGEVPEYVTVTESFLQRPLPALDLLFVVDDTRSMKGPQEVLAREFGDLAESLEQLKVRWQAGVTTMNRNQSTAGWLIGDPWIVTHSSPNAAEQLATNLEVGTNGVDKEAGMASAILALDLTEPGEANASFRRTDATLMVVFVSNNDDQSDEWLGSDPTPQLLQRLDAEISSYGVPATVSAIAGEGPDGCNSQNGYVAPAQRYIQAVAQTDGGFASICTLDVSGFWDGLVLGGDWYQSTFILSHSPDVTQSVLISVNQVPSVGTWELLLDPPRIRFETPPAPDATITVQYTLENQ